MPASMWTPVLVTVGGAFLGGFTYGYYSIKRENAKIVEKFGAVRGSERFELHLARTHIETQAPEKLMALERPPVVAAKAFGLATLATVGTFCLGIAAVRSYLDVDTVGRLYL
jgi:hypothetical protein